MEFGEVVLTRSITQCTVIEGGKTHGSITWNSGDRKSPFTKHNYLCFVNIGGYRGGYRMDKMTPEEFHAETTEAVLLLAEMIRLDQPELAAKFDAKVAAIKKVRRELAAKFDAKVAATKKASSTR